MLNTNFKKIDIIKEISKKTGFSVNFSKKVLNDLIDIIITELRHGDINIKNLGIFKIIFKNQRVGRNPITKKKTHNFIKKYYKFYNFKKNYRSFK